MTIKDRITKYIDYKGIENSRFEKKAGLGNGYVDKIRDGIRSTTIEKIRKSFPDLNIEWLKSGKGEMLIEEKRMEVIPVTDLQFMSVPLVPISAHAGYPSTYGDVGYIDTLPTFPVIVDREYKGKYRVFEVSGDSMDNGQREAICDKDKILGREVRRDLWTSKLHINDWFFVIVHREEGIIVKQIIDHDVEKGLIVCHSLNPLFDDFVVHLNDVSELYNVIKIVDRTARI